jgi:hypothetical protein
MTGHMCVSARDRALPVTAKGTARFNGRGRGRSRATRGSGRRLQTHPKKGCQHWNCARFMITSPQAVSSRRKKALALALLPLPQAKSHAHLLGILWVWIEGRPLPSCRRSAGQTRVPAQVRCRLLCLGGRLHFLPRLLGRRACQSAVPPMCRRIESEVVAGVVCHHGSSSTSLAAGRPTEQIWAQ